jgi:Xaa-Pro dipeptidase
MSKHDFPVSEFEERRARVRAAIAAAGLDWLVLIHPVSIHWLTGSDAKSYQEFQCLLLSAEPGPLTVLTREGEAAEFADDALVDRVEVWGGRELYDPIAAFARVAGPLGLTRARVGLEVPAYYLHPRHYLALKALLGVALVAEPTDLVHDLKLVKSPAEIIYIRQAARIADDAMDAFAAALAEGETELAVAGAAIATLMARGSALAASPINLVSGERSGFSHGAPTLRRLRRGDSVNVEYGATAHRYTATLGRQFSLGQPSVRLTEVYDVVRRACDACIAEMRDGVPAKVPHLAAKRVIGDAGLDRGRVHTSGYGLAPGFPPSWGEPLHMLAGSPYILRAGMVVSVEPPVFLGDERVGARIIDNVLVTPDGTELLSRFSRDLVVV